MSIIFRILLITFSVGALAFIMVKIRSSQMQIDGAVIWIISMFGLVIIGIFPNIVVFASRLLGIRSPANLVFVGVIFVLLLIIFNLSLKVSRQQYQIQQLTQMVVLEEKRKDTACIHPPSDETGEL